MEREKAHEELTDGLMIEFNRRQTRNFIDYIYAMDCRIVNTCEYRERQKYCPFCGKEKGNETK